MLKCSGFQIMGYLLETVPPEQFTESTVLRLEQLTIFISTTFGMFAGMVVFFSVCPRVRVRVFSFIIIMSNSPLLQVSHVFLAS